MLMVDVGHTADRQACTLSTWEIGSVSLLDETTSVAQSLFKVQNSCEVCIESHREGEQELKRQ